MNLYLYVIKLADRSHYKIGVAKNTADRLSALQAANPSRLELMLEVPLVYNEFKVERRVHKALKKYRIHREWFQLTPELVATIPALVKECTFGRTSRLPDNWRKFARCIRHSLMDCGWCRMNAA